MKKQTLLREEEKIKAWLDKHEIENYTIIPDSVYGFVVNVDEDVNLKCKNLTFIPVKFNEINGDFLAASNKLTTLTFAPEKVTGDFDIFNNKLESLEGLPKSIGYNLDISKNKLTSLKGCPEIVENNFSCSANKLTSLEFGPKEVYGVYSCDHNNIENLIHFPEDVGGDFVCYKNKRLGDLQKEYDFKKFHNIHLQQKLNKELVIKDNDVRKRKL